MKLSLTKEQVRRLIEDKLIDQFSVSYKDATNDQFYDATCLVVRELLASKRRKFVNKTHAVGGKQVYYLSMEFLLGRSLKNNMYNLGVYDAFSGALDDMDVELRTLFELEPDAGLGNGGLGRLAACYLDGLASQNYCATGYSICYEFGIFKQKIIDGWQTELPDNWLPGGSVWLTRRDDLAVDVHFDGQIKEYWDSAYHRIEHQGYTTVKAVPYDMYVSGHESEGVSVLRLWKAEASGIDMQLFNNGNYMQALGQNSMGEAISKVLYPNDNHFEGKSLRLRQQYFMVSASVTDIVRQHLATYSTVENLPEKVAIHINDTHPTLAIPELMRILLDECGYGWEAAYDIVRRTFAYTNHTVMSEALEVWNEDMFKAILPRIHQIVKEINDRFCRDLAAKGWSGDTISRMAIISYHQVKMANLCVSVCHSVNGVSKIHSEIIKRSVFNDFYHLSPEKFKNVTNGIAHRRWLYQSNQNLYGYLKTIIPEDINRVPGAMTKLLQYQNDAGVLSHLDKIKHNNKVLFAEYLRKHTGEVLDPDSIFDVQVKRMHEYKRQHMNAMSIIASYQYLRETKDADFVPKTYIFGAKAAPGYFLAKQIIRLIYAIGKEVDSDPFLREKLKVVYLQDYRVTLSELLMPASEVSKQISLAGTEASGTGNMKLMLSGAVTVGTMDGANVEIYEQVGKDNIITFGMTTDEVGALKKANYNSRSIYEQNPRIKAVIEAMYHGIGGETFEDVANSLVNSDPYMVLADFDSFLEAERKVSEYYLDRTRWNRMSLSNIAHAGVFAADRAVNDYARDIWDLRPIQ